MEINEQNSVQASGRIVLHLGWIYLAKITLPKCAWAWLEKCALKRSLCGTLLDTVIGVVKRWGNASWAGEGKKQATDNCDWPRQGKRHAWLGRGGIMHTPALRTNTCFWELKMRLGCEEDASLTHAAEAGLWEEIQAPLIVTAQDWKAYAHLCFTEQGCAKQCAISLKIHKNYHNSAGPENYRNTDIVPCLGLGIG